MSKIKELFYNPEVGLTNLNTFIKRLKKIEPDIKQKDIRDFYNAQEINQILKPVEKPKVFNSVIALFPKDTYEIDFIIYDRYTINNYKNIFCCVDVYSRFANCIATTNREMPTILKCLKDTIEVMGLPNRIKADNEFAKKEFIDYCTENNIECVFSDPYEINKNPIVERFNKTIALKLQKIRITSNNKQWYKYLGIAVNNYNTNYHSTIKNTPADVFNGKADNQQEYNTVETVFKVGDVVRIVIRKKIFQKGDSITYSPDVYRVIEVKGNRIKLDNDDKLYKPYEIKKVGDIIYKPDSKEEEEQNEKVNDLIKSTKIKKPEVQIENIIEGKRNRKAINYKE
jgi:hypothetical protein